MDDRINDILKQRFGMSRLRPHQAKVIGHLLAGHSTLAVLPTGGGKSLCYQLTSQLLPGLTIVVSPLIALMKDQCDALSARGIAAARLDQSVSHRQLARQWAAIEQGETKLLYVAPERFFNERFHAAIRSLTISMLAIDEAHCISQWGHAFRPDYLRLPQCVQQWNIPLTLALTATASKRVIGEISQMLSIDRPHVVVAPLHRKNLQLRRTIVGDASRTDLLHDRLASRSAGATLVYVTRRATAEQVAQELAARGWPAVAYHAGMDDATRDNVLRQFMASTDGIVVATIAFGMGVDKPNVRYVYHYNLSSSIESYSQEIGRAGRDGRTAICESLVVPEDRVALENLAHGDLPTPTAMATLLQRLIHQPDRFHIAPGKLAWEVNLRPSTLATMMISLHRLGHIAVLPVRYDTYRVQPQIPLTSMIAKSDAHWRGRVEMVIAALTKSRRDYRINLIAAINATGTNRETWIDTLEHLANRGWIELTVGDAMAGYQWLERPASWKRLATKLQNEMRKPIAAVGDRLDALLGLMTTNDCMAAELSRHFGGRNRIACGVCSPCSGETVGDVRPSVATGIGTSARSVLDSVIATHPDLFEEPIDRAKFLCGLSTPRFMQSRLQSHPGFGTCDEVPFQTVLRDVTA